MSMSPEELSRDRICDCCGREYSVDEFALDEMHPDHQTKVDSYKKVWKEFCFECFDSNRYLNAYGPFDRYTIRQLRKCKSCSVEYAIRDYWHTYQEYFPPPQDYESGCTEYCIKCWVTGDTPDSYDEEHGNDIHTEEVQALIRWEQTQTDSSPPDDDWPNEEIYESIWEGDLLTAYQWFFDRDCLLAVMPCGRLQVSRPRIFPDGFVFYPQGYLDLRQLNIHSNANDSRVLSEYLSAASGVDQQVFDNYSLVVFPVPGIDWNQLKSANHQSHLELIRNLSEIVDRNCLDYARYQTCHLDIVEGLPCHSGQVPLTNMMMAGLSLYNPCLKEGILVAGAAFTHCVTQGLGMVLDQYEWDRLPDDGEVGQIAKRALSMYTQILESSSQTSKFVQVMTLFEYLASPDHFEKFKDVKKIIARYSAAINSPEYAQILKRFHELTGLDEKTTDSKTGRKVRKHLGYRTRIVHLGEQLEQILPVPADRKELFIELEEYIRPVIDHMIQYSNSDYDEYCELRRNLNEVTPRNHTQELFDNDDIPF